MKGTLRIAMLHLAPVAGELAQNRRLMERAVEAAAGAGADWVLTPELGITGYAFADRLGTDWILPQPDPWMSRLCRSVAGHGVTLFLSHPERDAQTGKLHNSVFVIAPDGTIRGKHRKINTLRGGSESWSTPGEQAVPVMVPPLDGVGILICADAFSPGIGKTLKAQGAQLLVSAAAWAPGFHGPDGEWERCTKDTGLPLFVCNRTGADRTLDFTQAESVVVKDGERRLAYQAPHSTVLLVDWDLHSQDLAQQEFQTVAL